MKNESTNEFKELWREAYNTQDASNLSGVVHTFSRAVTKLWEIDRANENLGTTWVNSNPVTRLYIEKALYLAGPTKVSDWDFPQLTVEVNT